MSDFHITGLSTAVQKKIEDLVLQGKLRGGDKLNEVELAEMFEQVGADSRSLQRIGSSWLVDCCSNEEYSFAKWICVKLLRYTISEHSLIVNRTACRLSRD